MAMTEAELWTAQAKLQEVEKTLTYLNQTGQATAIPAAYNTLLYTTQIPALQAALVNLTT